MFPVCLHAFVSAFLYGDLTTSEDFCTSTRGPHRSPEGGDALRSLTCCANSLDARLLDQSHRDLDQMDNLGGDRTDHQVGYRTQATGSHDDCVALRFVDMPRNFVGR